MWLNRISSCWLRFLIKRIPVYMENQSEKKMFRICNTVSVCVCMHVRVHVHEWMWILGLLMSLQTCHSQVPWRALVTYPEVYSGSKACSSLGCSCIFGKAILDQDIPFLNEFTVWGMCVVVVGGGCHTASATLGLLSPSSPSSLGLLLASHMPMVWGTVCPSPPTIQSGTSHPCKYFLCQSTETNWSHSRKQANHKC